MANKVYDLPPFLKGTEQDQINQLKEYLTKLVLELNQNNKGETTK